MFKILCACFIIACTSFIGISASDKLKNRADTLKKIEHMFEEMSVLIRYKAVTVFELIDELKNNSMLSKLDFLHIIKTDSFHSFSYSWINSIENSNCFLSQRDKELLKSFGERLGSSDIDGQLSSIALYKENFIKLKESAVDEYMKKSRLYRSFGILGGMFIAIIVI